MKKSFKLSDFATIFSTRTKADEIADNLGQYIKTLSDEDILLIDFSKVEAISYSFLDQFLSRLIEFPLLKEKRILITGWSKNIVSVINNSLQHRNYKYTQSNSDTRRVLVG